MTPPIPQREPMLALPPSMILSFKTVFYKTPKYFLGTDACSDRPDYTEPMILPFDLGVSDAITAYDESQRALRQELLKNIMLL